MAQRIFDRYITTNASLEINLDDHVKRNIIQYFLSSSSTTPSYVFSEAKTSAYVLLETSFHRFLTSCVYDDMLTNCGELTIHYNERVRGVALNFLVEYLRTQQDLLLMHSENHTALSDTLVRLNSKHYELIKSMIQGFIRNTFGVDYMASKIAAFSIITAAKNSHGSR